MFDHRSKRHRLEHQERIHDGMLQIPNSLAPENVSQLLFGYPVAKKEKI